MGGIFIMTDEYNLLTKRLLAEGYTADNHPEYVRISAEYRNSLDNSDGGFVYTADAEAERVYEAPCGRLCYGEYCLNKMSWCGIEFCHENDNPVIPLCPYGKSCDLRPEPFASQPYPWCVAHPTDRSYVYEDSLECLEKEVLAKKNRDRDAFLASHRNACIHHMKYRDATGRWEFRYDPSECTRVGCHNTFCPCLQKNLGSAKGNIFYDLETDAVDHTKDGTFWEGDRIRAVCKGLSIFSHPVNLTVLDAYLKVYGKRIIREKEAGSCEDCRVTVRNLHAAKRYQRDVDKDLEDTDSGIIVRHQKELDAMEKESKRKKRAVAAEKRLAKLRKRIVTDGVEVYEVESLIKKLGKDEYLRLLNEHNRRSAERKTKQAPVQLSLFDMTDIAPGS